MAKILVVEDEAERERVGQIVREHLWWGDWRSALTALSEHLPARTYRRKRTQDLCAYIRNQRKGIINYGLWHKAGRRVSTSIVEKTGDLVIVRRNPVNRRQ